MIQKVLKSKRKVRYDVGIALHEVGDVQGWWLNGARKGRLQEIYFNRNNMIWLVAAPTTKRGGPQRDQLLARLEMLPLWDLDKPHTD
jgi:hypothetical protein